MNRDPITRRQAGARLVQLAAAAGAAGGLVGPALASLAGTQPPRVPKKEKDQNNKPPARSSTPSAPTPLDRLLTQGRSYDWTLKIWVQVHGYQHVQKDVEPVLEDISFQSAAVVFPVNRGCASSRLDADAVVGILKFNDRVVDDKPKYSDEGTPPILYQSGTRLARWEMQNLTGREVGLQLELPMSCWETRFDEPAAMAVKWPASPWPPAAASTLQPDAIADHNAPEVRALVHKWTEGKDPKSISPVRLAKFLMGRVLETLQPSGDGLAFSDSGMFRGVVLKSVAETISSGRGSDHDITNVLAAVYRAAGLPARTVIGYDVSDKKGEDSSFLQKQRKSAKLRPWVEFCLYDEGAQKELWVPVDVLRLRRQGSRAPSLDAAWKYFGSHDELDDVMPFAFQYHPPTTVVAHGYPAFWGWFTTPSIPRVEQWLRFDAQTTPRRSGAPPRQPGRGG
jgi:hypothetical protein